jgi:3-deoxy-7-phosphoheptulonate synthase
LLNDPFLNGSDDIQTGIYWTRGLLLDLIDRGVPAAAEFLDPISPYYLADLVSWGSIGARTIASQVHRQIASLLPMPIGFKNRTDGHLESAIHGMITAQSPHTFFGINEQGLVSKIQTSGNRNTHIVLRGGNGKANCDPDSVQEAIRQLQEANLPDRIMIDCSHDNSNKQHELQPVVFQSVIDQILKGNSKILGMILESNLESGKQPFHSDPSKFQYGVSVTDSCLDWNTTEHWILWAYEKLSMNK